jgi:hypothetical protein
MKHSFTVNPKDVASPPPAPSSSPSEACDSSDRLATLTAVISGVPNLLPAEPQEITRPLSSAHSYPMLFPPSPPLLSFQAPLASVHSSNTQSSLLLHVPESSVSSVTLLSPAGSPCDPPSPTTSSPSAASTPSPVARKRQRKGSSNRLNCLMDSGSSTNSAACTNNGGMECN